MQHDAVFYLCLLFLPNYPLRGFQYNNGKGLKLLSYYHYFQFVSFFKYQAIGGCTYAVVFSSKKMADIVGCTTPEGEICEVNTYFVHLI